MGKRSAHRDYVFGPDLFGLFVGARVHFRVEYHLAEAASVSQVDEYNAAVVAPRVNPAGENHFATHASGARFATVATALPIAQRIAKNPLRHHWLTFSLITLSRRLP